MSRKKRDSYGEMVQCFQDTLHWCRSDPELKRRVSASISGTVLYPEGTAPALGPARFPEGTSVTVSRRRSFSAALHALERHPDSRVAVLNFASAIMPGGPANIGCQTQEEALCRCSTLYPVLDTPQLQQEFYAFHRARRDSLYTDACIYSPDVTIIKTDEAFPQRMDPGEWRKADILTCAAPALAEGDLKKGRITKEALLALHKKRGRQILRVAAHHGADVVILGAFGCGAFCNPPAVVAQAYRELMDKFDGQFRAVEFAVACSRHNASNYDAFARAMV